MYLEVTRSGGFAGLTRHWSTDIPDPECAPLIAALREADKNENGGPDERVYEIHLGDTTARVPERRAHHGALAVLIERAQDDHHTR